MIPEQLVDLVDFRYLSDALTPTRRWSILRRAEPGRAARAAEMRCRRLPGVHHHTRLARLLRREADPARQGGGRRGFGQIKLKVGADLEDDIRRMRAGPGGGRPRHPDAVDANQRWDVAEAVAWMRALAPFDPYWIEEPTSPDDILAHAAIRAGQPVRVATGEHVANRVVFKQLLQAGAVDFVQIDAARVGGVNENLAILLLAAKFGVPVCPHAGGVGLCELVQHLSMFDYVAVSGSLDGRVIEYVDHLHEHFTDPVVIDRGRYRAPAAPGFSARMVPESARRLPLPGRTGLAGPDRSSPDDHRAHARHRLRPGPRRPHRPGHRRRLRDRRGHRRAARRPRRPGRRTRPRPARAPRPAPARSPPT